VEVKVLIDGQRAVERIELRDNSNKPPRMGRMLNHVDALGCARFRWWDARVVAIEMVVVLPPGRPQQSEDLALFQSRSDAIEGHHAQLRQVNLGQFSISTIN